MTTTAPPARFPGSRTTGATLYRTPSGLRFTDADVLEREYDVDASVTDLPAVLDVFAERTRRARAELPATFGVAYGPTPSTSGWTSSPAVRVVRSWFSCTAGTGDR